MFKRGLCFLAFLLCLTLSASSLYADEMSVYLYDQDVSSEVDIGKYLSTGEVRMLEGFCFFHKVTPGPAPAPYPQVHVWDKGIEQLGKSMAEMDGIRFIHFGRYWRKNQMVLVLWKIRIPQASLREASEFEKDLTMSIWVDWNQDETWGKNEIVHRKHINIQRFFPTTCETMCIYYLTWFRVPDIEEFTPDWWWKKDLENLWVRGVLAYDDRDVSPDGEQLFGEVEDYQVTYWKR